MDQMLEEVGPVPGSALDVLSGLLGKKPEELEPYLVPKPRDPGRERELRLLALPRPRTVNLYVLIEAQNELVVRHEGGEDFTEFQVAGFNVPGILNTKVQAAERRALLRLLYDFYDRRRGDLVEEVAKLAEKMGFSEAAGKLRSGAWRCYLAPVQKRKQEETIVPYCGFCPGCMIYGYAGMDQGGGYNVKSRVEGDVFYGLCPSTQCVVQRTFNAVDDVTKTTFYETGETGALYRLSLIEPGTVFVGKIVVRDPSPAELLAVLLAVAHVERIGARVTHFGTVKTHIPFLVFSRFERGTSYEAASRLLGGGKRLGLEEAVEGLRGYVGSVAAEGDLVVERRGLADELRRLSSDTVDEVLAEAWMDALAFKKGLELFVTKSQQR